MLALTGQVYESPVDWEENFADMVKPGELEPRHLRLLMMKNLGVAFSGEALAFAQLQEAVSSNNKGVVVSDKPLSDTSRLKGKVVLIDFWATWCGPCVAEVPHVKQAYDKFHDKGFEVVGISFDSDKGALEKFVKSKDLPWPQYFDGKGWQNQFGKEYGIEAIPTMWLVNREGKVVDTNARSDLAGKVGRLIAQN